MDPTKTVENEQDGPSAQRIAEAIPYYPFHGVPRFYDISGMLQNPELFQLCVDVFARRYAALEVDCIAGVDARGFILGPPIALALKKPFIMVRKAGKLPNATTGGEYFKEYKGVSSGGGDSLCAPRAACKAGDRVMVIDDLMATGGTMIAACDLLTSLGMTVVEAATIVELKALEGSEKLKAKYPSIGVWALMTEDILQFDGTPLLEQTA